ncbi:metal ABC transporter permease, partial [Nocardia farcinica]|uniref:metal ABC transporter permease n=1 Tax=Nocardia farcinica TaxID=37329 RepID=UPI002454018B
VGRGEQVQVVVLAAITLLALVLLRRDFTLFAFDPTHAHAIGLNPRVRWAGGPPPRPGVRRRTLRRVARTSR